MEKIKEFCKNHIVGLVCITTFVFFVFSIWLLYTANRAANEYSDVHDTVQSVESDNQQARQQINSASEQIEHAQKELNHGIERTYRIAGTVNEAKRRADDDTKIINDCNKIIDAGRRDTAEARSIFADIDERNKITGAQADSNP